MGPKIMKCLLCPRMHHFSNHTRQEISTYYCSMSTSQNYHNTIEYINSHLFTLKTTINGNEIKILLDPGGDRTIISPSLLKKVATKHQGSTPLNINTITGKKKSIQANMYSLTIPSKEG